MGIKFLSNLNEKDSELARREYITRIVLFYTFIVSIFFTIVSFLFYYSGKIPVDTFITSSIIMILHFAGIILITRGFWRAAGFIPPFLMYISAIRANIIGGIDVPGNLLYALLIIFVAIIFSYRRMWIALAICLITYIFIAWLIHIDYINPYRSGDIVFTNRVVISSVCFISIALLIWFLGRSYQIELDEKRKAENLINQKNEELTALNEELQASIEELEATNEAFENVNADLLKSRDELVEYNERLKLSEKRFYQIFHSSPISMSLNDLETGEYLEVNEILTRNTGFSRDEILGKTILEIGYFTKEQMVFINKNLREKGYINNFEYTISVRNQKRIILLNALITTIDSRQCIISSSIDITDKKIAEENLLKAQRLESLGLIAGGLAHDFNNILMGIFGNLSLARLNISDPEYSLSFIKNSEDACISAQDLTRQLLTFSKGGLPVKSRFNPAKLIQNAVKFNLAGSKVKADVEIQDDLWSIEADEGQINQVLNNLLLNAVQSMPSGGKIKITLDNLIITDNEKIITSTGIPDTGKFVKLSITDTGKGIHKDNLVKIFDPYFTTRHGGSGLGLAVVYSIITNHLGYLDVSSEEGVGSVFTIYLPIAEKRSAEKVTDGSEKNYNSNIKSPEMNTESPGLKILIMDDEESIISVIKVMLSHLGYRSDGAKSGTEAIELYKESLSKGDPYTAVIMDLTIPGDIGGKEAISLFKKINPQIRAIVSSGYSDDSVFSDYLSYGFKSILRKPFRIEELAEALKTAFE